VDSKEELSKQISASSANQPALSFPTIKYDRQRLEKIIKYVSLSNGYKKETAEFLDTIDKEVALLREYQAEELLSDFYPQIRASVDKINGAATSLYQIIEKYDAPTVSSLRNLMAQCFGSFEKELTHRLAMSQQARNELELKTKRLYAQQSFVARSSTIQQSLMQHLSEISDLLKRPGEPSPRCYISYAWPSIENKDKEYWIQPFLYILYDHLKAAGIDMVLDIRDSKVGESKVGESIYGFMNQYSDGNYIITVGTESLREKHLGDNTAAVKTELNIALNKHDKDKRVYGSSRIYPLLISGTLQTSFPDVYQMYRNVQDGREGFDVSYIELIEKLVDWLHHNKLNNNQDLKLKGVYVNKWRNFNDFYKSQNGLTNQANAAEIEAELKLGLHKERLEHLRQDLTYQAVKVQEETEFSSVTQTKITGVLMESSGINPQNLWDAAGKQYQRPQTNPHFIPREALQDEINAHFKDKDQQILTLTAHGMGGMGKTTLASFFFQHPIHPYTIRAWFNAGSREQIYQQYLDLAKQAEGIEYPKEMPIDSQAQRVKQWLEKQKDCLLVFDNVERREDLDGLLPEQGKHHILITSRSEVDWPKRQLLNVDRMEIEEAIDLLVKMTGIDKEKNQALLQELVSDKYLGCLPLAVAQAGAYMDAKSIDIKEYMNRFKQSQVKFLSEENFNIKHLPVWVTFDMNFKALQEDCPLALNTLKQASWLNASSIPEALLIDMIEIEDKNKAMEAWDDIKGRLKRYSLMRLDKENHLATIHPLLQEILRNKQTEKEQIEIFKFVCKKMDEIFANDKTSSSTYRGFLPHAERLNQHGKHFATLANKLNDKYASLLSTQPNCLNDIYFKLGLVKNYLVYLTTEKAAYEKLYGPQYVYIATTLGNLGTVYYQLGLLKEAREYLERALRIQEKHYDSQEHFAIAPTLENLGLVYGKFGLLKEAKEYLERALRIEEEHYGSQEHFAIATTLGNLGLVYYQLGNLKEAREYYERALKIKEKHYGSQEHFAIATTLENLGNVYGDLGSLKEAKEYYERALRIIKTGFGEKHFQTAIVMKYLGDVLNQAGNLDVAKKYLEQALEIEERHFGKDGLETSKTLVYLGDVYRQLGNIIDANEILTRALKIQEAHYDKNCILLVNTLYNLSLLYQQLGELQQAKEYLLRAKEISVNGAGGQQYLPKIERLLKEITAAPWIDNPVIDTATELATIVDLKNLDNFALVLEQNVHTINPKQRSRGEDENISLSPGSMIEKKPNFSSFFGETSGVESLISGKNTLTLNHRQIVGKDEPYYEGAVAADGSCLFYAVGFAYLFPVAHNVELFRQRFICLFGEKVADAAEENRRYFIHNGGREILQNPEVLQILVNANFRKRVVEFMRKNKENFLGFMPENEDFVERMLKMENPDKNAWGDQPEIAAMSKMLGVNTLVYQKEGETLTPVLGAEHKIEGSNTEICLLYTQAQAENTTSNPNNHYNYLLRGQDLPGNKAKLQKGEVVPEAIPTGSNSNKTETTAAPAIIASSGSVINVGVSSLIPWPTFSYSAGIPKAKETINSKKVTQSKSHSVISSGYTAVQSITYLSESFANAAQNMRDSAGQIANPLLFTQRMAKGARKIAQSITNDGRAGIVDSLQQLARPGCSFDGTARIGRFGPR